MTSISESFQQSSYSLLFYRQFNEICPMPSHSANRVPIRWLCKLPSALPLAPTTPCETGKSQILHSFVTYLSPLHGTFHPHQRRVIWHQILKLKNSDKACIMTISRYGQHLVRIPHVVLGHTSWKHPQCVQETQSFTSYPPNSISFWPIFWRLILLFQTFTWFIHSLFLQKLTLQHFESITFIPLKHQRWF